MYIIVLELPAGIGEMYGYAGRRGNGGDGIRTGWRCHAGRSYASGFRGVDLLESECGGLPWVGADTVLFAWWSKADRNGEFCGRRECECGAGEDANVIWDGCGPGGGPGRSGSWMKSNHVLEIFARHRILYLRYRTSAALRAE